MEHHLADQREKILADCSADAEVAVQHAVDMVVEAGKDALAVAVKQAEERCRVEKDIAIEEAVGNEIETCSFKMKREVSKAEERVRSEWKADLEELKRLFQDKMEETRRVWMKEMLDIDTTVIREQVSSEEFLMDIEGSGSNALT